MSSNGTGPTRDGSGSIRPRAFRLAALLLIAGLVWLQSGSGPSRVDPDLGPLEVHLVSWRACQETRLLRPNDDACSTVTPPPEEQEELARRLRALSGLERYATHYAEAGGAPAAISRCLSSVAADVEQVVFARSSGLEQPLDPSSDQLDCAGIRLPTLPEGDAGLDFAHACAYALGDERADLGACIRTLAEARLAEGGVGPPLRRPNIVLILTDDQRWDTVDATHSPNPALGTPAMPITFGRLAGEGLSFTQMVVTSPVCGPSRGSFFTGLNTHRHGMLANGGPLGAVAFDDANTWATHLHAAGYRTGFLGKYTNGFTELWTEGVDPPVIPPGWDDFKTFNHVQGVPQTGFEMIENGEIVSYDVDDQPYATDVLAQHALSFITKSLEESPDEPFALWISTTTPHFPWNPAERHVGAFDDYELVTTPSTFEADVSDKPSWIQERAEAKPMNYTVQRKLRQKQLEMQLSTDEMVGALLDHLESLGADEDTIVVYTSDNGHAWGEHRWNTKACPWEECLRVPMFIRYPRLVPGARTIEGLVASVDLVPTLVGLAGGPVPEDVDGIDLGDLVRGVRNVPEREVLFGVYSKAERTYVGVRADHMKYVLYLTGQALLYDLEADPFELENFAERPDYQPIRKALHARLLEMWPGFF